MNKIIPRLLTRVHSQGLKGLCDKIIVEYRPSEQKIMKLELPNPSMECDQKLHAISNGMMMIEINEKVGPGSYEKQL